MYGRKEEGRMYSKNARKGGALGKTKETNSWVQVGGRIVDPLVEIVKQKKKTTKPHFCIYKIFKQYKE